MAFLSKISQNVWCLDLQKWVESNELEKVINNIYDPWSDVYWSFAQTVLARLGNTNLEIKEWIQYIHLIHLYINEMPL